MNLQVLQQSPVVGKTIFALTVQQLENENIESEFGFASIWL